MIAIIDTDGTRLVVWGMGETAEAARADAREQEGYEETSHEQVRELTENQAGSIEKGSTWPFSGSTRSGDEL